MESGDQLSGQQQAEGVARTDRLPMPPMPPVPPGFVELSWSFVGHLSNALRQAALEQEVRSLEHQWLRASMASGMREAKSNVFEFMADCKPETEDRRWRICSSLDFRSARKNQVARNCKSLVHKDARLA